MTHLGTAIEAPEAADHRCSPWTAAEGVDPIGSAGRYDAFLLVEAPLPWPKDVGGIPALARAAEAGGTTRVLAVPPHSERPHARTAVTAWRRTGTHRFAGTDHEVDTAQLPRLLDALVADPALAGPTAVGDAPPDVLICSHGKRDACCGRYGTLLHAEVAARWDGVRVRRCSHTGGHRFAPTSYTFPDGRAWAHLDAGLLDRIVGRSGPVADLHRHQRGTTALDDWGQALERAVFEHVGWAWLDAEVTGATTDLQPSGQVAEVALAWRWPDGRTGRATGTVAVHRRVPVLVCGEPPENATKDSPELRLARLALDA
ncbi:MAG: sucrase ferredoxin [Acidimicrobiia bacterium]